MSSYAARSWSAPIGPIKSDDVECAHGGPTLQTDPALVFIRKCEQDAVFRVSWSRSCLGTVAVCPFHLARYLDARPDRAALLRKHFDNVDELVEGIVVSLDDAPDSLETDAGELPAVALDQLGRIHYADVSGGSRAILRRLDEDPDVDELADFATYMERICKIAGFAEISPRVRLPTDAEGAEP